jgi:hypothetical protein
MKQSGDLPCSEEAADAVAYANKDRLAWGGGVRAAESEQVCTEPRNCCNTGGRFAPNRDHQVLRSARKKVPGTAGSRCSNVRGLLDHLIRLREDGRRYLKTNRLRNLEVDDKLKFGRELDWQFAWVCAP